MTRDLIWDGCLNVRDLGGLPTEDGGVTRFRSVVRADNVRRLSEGGWQALAEYGVTTIVDLRLSEELAEDPPRELDLDVLHIPVFDDDPAFWAALDERLVRLDAVAHKREGYLATLRRCRYRFSSAFTAVANARAGVVVVHCAGGKDRTGLVCALLLRNAGVAIEEIAADYALAEERLAEPRPCISRRPPTRKTASFGCGGRRRRRRRCVGSWRSSTAAKAAWPPTSVKPESPRKRSRVPAHDSRTGHEPGRGQLLVNWPEQKGAGYGKASGAKGGMVERNGKGRHSVATVFA